MRYLLLSVLVVCVIGIMVIPNAFAENLYYYVEPIPTRILPSPDYVVANLELYESTIDIAFLSWSVANPNLKFIETASPTNADIHVVLDEGEVNDYSKLTKKIKEVYGGKNK